MVRKPSSLALAGLALLCAAIFAACNEGPTLRFVSISPSSGTIYVSAPPGAGVKAARRAVRPTSKVSRRAAVSPQDLSVATCGSLQFSGTAYYSNGTTQPESSTLVFNWSSSNTSAATVDQTGLATGVGLGTTNIGASLNGISATAAPLEVDQLNSITMNPTSGNIPNGTTGFAFMAIGNFTLASGSPATQDISSQVTWNSTNTNVATVDTAGNITTVGQGTTSITATSCDGITVGTAPLTVGAPPPPPVTLVITPAAPTIAAGTTVELITVTHSDNSPVTNPVTWQSGTTTVAMLTPDPNNPTQIIALGVSAGTSMITATEATTNYTGNATLTVQAAATRYAYVAEASGFVSSYTVNVSGGTLTNQVDTPAASGAQEVLLHPSGDLLYYIDHGSSIHSFLVNSTTGALTPTGLTPSIDTCTTNPPTDTSVGVIDPYGRFVYVVSVNGQCIFGFSITQVNAQTTATTPGPPTAGTLTPIPGMGAPAGITDPTNLPAPTWVMTDRAGKYLYVVNNVTPGLITQYSIDQTTGALTLLSPATVPAGNGTTNSPLFGTTDINGHLFVANTGTSTTDETVSAYNITASGQLQSVGSDTVITGATGPINALTDPTAKYLYVLDLGTPPNVPGQVFAFNLSSSGVIGSQIGTAQPTGVSPFGAAIDPTGALLAIDNNFSNNISLHTVATSGTSAGGLTPATPPTVNTTAGGSPAFVMFYNAASGQ